MALATASALGAGDYSWRFSLGAFPSSANWAAARLPINGGFGGALTNIAETGSAPKGIFDSGGGPGGGGGSGVSSGDVSGDKQAAFGAQPSFTTGRAIRNIGRALSLVASTPIGTAVGALGTLADYEEANAALAARGFPKVSGLKTAINALSFGFLGQSPQEQYNAYQGFGLGPAVETDDFYSGLGYSPAPQGPGFDDALPEGFTGWGGAMSQADIDAIDQSFETPGDYADISSLDDKSDFGGWGGYDSDYNDGPGADAESDDSGNDDDGGDDGGDDE